MKLIFNEGRFEVQDYTKKLPGFVVEYDTGVQYTIDAQLAKAYLHYADSATELEVYKQEAELKSVILQSRAVEASIFVPVNKGLSYLPYQNAAVQFALQKKRILLADEMGLGKTVEAIEIINYFIARKQYLAPRILVICPGHLKQNWEDELGKWLIEEHGIAQADSKYFPKYAQVVIIHYEALDKWYDELRWQPWSFLIVDECQNLSNIRAQRTQLVYGNHTQGIEPIPCDRALLLSGTPFNNRPIELWPALNYLDPERWNSRIEYGIEYCAGKKSKDGKKWILTGASKLPQLQAKLRSTVMLRRLKDDVLTELPPKRRQVIELPPGEELLEFIKEEIDAYNSYNSKIDAAKQRADTARELKDTDEYKAAMEALRYTENIRFQKMAEFRHKTGLATLPFAVAHIRELLATDIKVVAFFHHHDVGEPLYREFKDNAVIVYGGKEQTLSNQEAVHKFQTDPSCQLWLGSVRMMTGHTLTAAAHEVMVELDWTPSVIKQAEDRCHRIGQKESILIQYLVLARSLAAKMAHKIVDKLAMQEEALDKEEIWEDQPEVVI